MLLDTLWTVFKSDTTQSDQGLDRTKEKTQGLLDKIREADVASQSAGFSLKSMALGALGGLTAVLGVSSTISSAFARADMVVGMQKTSEAINVAIEDVDAFGRAARDMGGDAKGAQADLSTMADKIKEAMVDVGSSSAKAFKDLGINLKSADGTTKNAIQGMLELADAVDGLDRKAAEAKIKDFGISDSGTIEGIIKGRKELELMLRTQKEQGVVSKEAAENAKNLTEGIDKLKKGISNATDTILYGFLDAIIPALTKVIEWLEKGMKWMRDNKEFALGFFGAIAAVVTAVYLPAMLSAAAATIAATWPMIAIGVAIAAAAAAFALIYDDIMNFIDGNDSFIGQIFEKYPMVEKVIMALIDAFKQMWGILITGAQQIGQFVAAGFMQVVDGIKFAIDYLVEAYDAIAGFVSKSIDTFQSLADGVASIFSFIVDTVKSSLNFVSAGIDKIKSGVSGVVSFFGGGEDDDSKKSGSKEENKSEFISQKTAKSKGGSEDVPLTDEAMNAANMHINNSAGSPSNSVTSNAITNSARTTSETNLQIGQITVETQATDAKGISKEMGSELQSQLKNLEHESATGVAR